MTFVVNSGSAQRIYKGEKSISIIESTDGDLDLNSGSFYLASILNISYNRINKNRTRWVLGTYGESKSYMLHNDWAKTKTYVADVGYYIPMIMSYKRNWIFSFGFGLNTGYEYINNNGRRLFLSEKNQFVQSNLIYGGFGSFQNELYLSNRIIWMLDCKLRNFQGSDFSKKYQSSFGTGIKFKLK